MLYFIPAFVSVLHFVPVSIFLWVVFTVALTLYAMLYLYCSAYCSACVCRGKKIHFSIAKPSSFPCMRFVLGTTG